MVSTTCDSCPYAALQFASHQQIEFLVGAAQLDIGFERHRVVSLGQRIEQFVQGDGLFFLKALVEVFALEHLRDGELGREANEVIRSDFANHSAVEASFVLCRIENFVDLRHVSFGVAHDFFAGERRARSGAPGRVADHASEVADQKNDGVAEVLKMFELAKKHGVAEMKVGRSGIESRLYAQRLAGGARFFELGAEFTLADDFRGAFFYVGELFVNRGEVGHD